MEPPRSNSGFPAFTFLRWPGKDLQPPNVWDQTDPVPMGPGPLLYNSPEEQAEKRIWSQGFCQSDSWLRSVPESIVVSSIPGTDSYCQ